VIKRQRAFGLVGGLIIGVAGAQAIAGSQEMVRQHLWIGLSGDFQHVGKPVVAPAPGGGSKMRQDGLANPVVINLDLIELGWTDAPDEPRRAQRGQCNAAARSQFGGPERKRLVGSSRDRLQTAWPDWRRRPCCPVSPSAGTRLSRTEGPGCSGLERSFPDYPCCRSPVRACEGWISSIPSSN